MTTESSLRTSWRSQSGGLGAARRLDPVDREPITGLHRSPACSARAAAARSSAAARASAPARRPRLTRTKLVQQRSGAADVIGVAMRQHSVSSRRRRARRSTARRRGRRCRTKGCPKTAGVDEQRRAARKADPRRVPLPDIDEGHMQPAVPGADAPPPAARSQSTQPLPTAMTVVARNQRRRIESEFRRPARSASASRGSRRRRAPHSRAPQPMTPARRLARSTTAPSPAKPTTARALPPRGGPPNRRCRAIGPHHRQRHNRHPGHLRDGHERNRREVEDQAGNGHAREDRCANRQEHGLGADRRAEERRARLPQAGLGTTMQAASRSRQGCRRSRRRSGGTPGSASARRLGGEQQRGRRRQDVRRCAVADRSRAPARKSTAVRVARSTDRPPPTM